MIQVVPETKSVRLVLEGERLEAWESLLAEKQVSQQAAMVKLIDYILAQDSVAQSMILGQIPASDDLIELALRRMRGLRGKGSGPTRPPGGPSRS